jgi:hypothetical protein
MLLLGAVRQRDVGTLQALLSATPLAGTGETLRTITPTAGEGGASSLGKSPGMGSFLGRPRRGTTGQVDQNERDSGGNSALHLAVAAESPALLTILLSLAPRLNVNFQDFESGYTAMHKVLFAP